MQAVVREFNANGLPGEISRESPRRINSWNLDSSALGETNKFGHAYTFISEGTATIGFTGAFVGVLVAPKEQALVGDGADALAPFAELPDGSIAELTTKGPIYLEASASGSQGDLVFFFHATGVIAFGTPVANTTLIVGAKLMADCEINEICEILL